MEPGATVAVEAPTYLGALQAFAPYEADIVTVECDDQGPVPQSLSAARVARFLYLLPNFQNPSGRCIGAARRNDLTERAQACGLPNVEDNPYGELWFDEAPPPPMAALRPHGTIYLGSFSKVLAPGLRLDYLISPSGVHAKFVHAKQGADLHTSIFVQRVVMKLLQTGMLSAHLASIRQRYRAQRDAMSVWPRPAVALLPRHPVIRANVTACARRLARSTQRHHVFT